MAWFRRNFQLFGNRLPKYDLLPKEHWFAHDYCLELHDQLVNIIAMGEAQNIFNYSFQFSGQDELIEFEQAQKKNSGGFFFDWLADTEYKQIARELTYRQLLAALLSDFLQYLIAALHNSSKGRLSVTFSLLRKPFKDNLLLLEWLLSDEDELLRVFLKSEISELSIEKIDSGKKLSIIEGAIKLTELPEWIHAEFVMICGTTRTPTLVLRKCGTNLLI